MSEEQTQEKQHWIVYPIGSKPKWGMPCCSEFSSI
jgi:hypothetical protein